MMQQKRYNVNTNPVQHCAVWLDDVEGNSENRERQVIQLDAGAGDFVNVPA